MFQLVCTSGEQGASWNATELLPIAYESMLDKLSAGVSCLVSLHVGFFVSMCLCVCVSVCASLGVQAGDCV